MILNERLFELFAEGKRRQDLIRFGGYTGRTDAASGWVGGKNGTGGLLRPVPDSADADQREPVAHTNTRF